MTDKIIEINMLSGKKLEQLSNIDPLEVSKDVESLSVFQEVRKELAQAYTENKGATKTIEHLTSERDNYKSKYTMAEKTIEQLSTQLDTYKTREAEATKIAYNKRLEQLSKDFGELGQEKTIEHLSTLPSNVIAEFESITLMALKTKSEEKLNSVTVPTQAMPSIKSDATPVKKSVEILDTKGFIAGLAKTLTSQQDADKGSRRVQLM